jgi:hypothetical protein
MANAGFFHPNTQQDANARCRTHRFEQMTDGFGFSFHIRNSEYIISEEWVYAIGQIDFIPNLKLSCLN